MWTSPSEDNVAQRGADCIVSSQIVRARVVVACIFSHTAPSIKSHPIGPKMKLDLRPLQRRAAADDTRYFQALSEGPAASARDTPSLFVLATASFILSVLAPVARGGLSV